MFFIVDFDSCDVCGWLGLTPQQFDVLYVVFSIQRDGGVASPSLIKDYYFRFKDGVLQKPNLFSILRLLVRRGLLARVGKGRYEVSISGVRGVLQDRKVEFQEKLDELELFSSEVEELFLQFSSRYQKPVVDYLDYNGFFNKVEDYAKISNQMCISGRFANILYDSSLLDVMERGSCYKSMWELCVKGKLEITYLTSLEIEYIWSHSLKHFKSPNLAFDKCMNTIALIGDKIHSNHLKVFYTKNLQGLHLIIPERKEPEAFLMYLRDSFGEIIGGVYIKSRDTALRAKKMFMNECDKAVDLNSKKGGQVLKDLKRDLKQKFKSVT